MSINKDEFKEFVKDLIFPLFTGLSILEEDLPIPKNNRDKLVTTCKDKGDTILRLMPEKDAKFVVSIQRSQKFNKSEIELIRRLLKHANEYGLYQVDYKKELVDFIHNKSVAETLSTTADKSILEIINIFMSLSQETYEGHHISYAVAISEEEVGNSEIYFKDIIKEDFGKTLTNSIDSLLCLDKNCMLLSHMQIESIEQNSEFKQCYYPLRFEKLANRSLTKKLLVIVLTRDGEILIFKEGNLIFSRRRGIWTYYLHDILIKQMGIIRNQEVKKSIYSTILDASFSKGGACIAVVNSETYLQDLYDKKNFIGNNEDSPLKSKCCYCLILNSEKTLKFNQLPRILRLEFSSMDGAVLLKTNGDIIAIGAIINIKDGEISEGGRTAAARKLAEKGIAVKVSNDGYIRAFKKKDKRSKESFRIA